MTDKPQATGPLTSLDRDTRALEKEIERRGVILGIDWNDAAQVRALAEEALSHDRLPVGGAVKPSARESFHEVR